MKTMNKRDQTETPNSEYELYFLITKFLEAGPCSKAFEVLKNELCKHEILPKRYDWEGNQHEQTFEEVEQKFRHIGPKHLVEICQRIGPLLDKEIPPCTAGLSSLLGAGKQSIMRTHKDTPRTWHTLVECSIRKHQIPLINSINRRNNHIISVLHGRECSGPFSRKQAFPPRMYSRMQLLSRTLGHLSAVYCCLFDGTGRYVLTGADDMLIKVWSAIDGRLLATLRGVLSELTDIAVNLENTLLAAGSVDKIIRVWCLQTAYPVAVLIAHTGIITGVNFCPGIINGLHYLASTSTDGSVAFWSYTVGPNNAVTFHPKALQYNERMRPGQAQMICASFSPGGIFMAAGSADHHVRVYRMVGDNPEGPHRILETEPHSDRVDSIQWAHSGLRFISGSKDGTAIIWRFTRQRWKTHILSMATKLPGKPEVAVDPKLKLKVTMVCWNTNDKWAITACNDHSIKVWDSETAKLFEVLYGHKDEVFVLESHPLDPNVLLSAGHDGLILLWDLQSGTQLASFQNTVENNGHGAVFDAKWSPDGSMMVATDSHGHILLFGLGFVNDKIKKLPKELFFHTDYRPLVRDASHNVLDEQTQVAPHLMPPPFLVDIDGNPYPPYLQRLVPGRENCRTEQLVPNIIMSPGGQQEVIEGLDEPRSNIDQMIQALVNRSGSEQQNNNASSASLGSMLNNQRPSLSPRSARGMRGRGDVEGVRQSIGNWQRDEFSWTRRQLITPLDKGTLENVREKVQFYGSLELEEYKWEMQRTMEFKPTPMTSKEFIKRKQTRKKQTHAYRTRGSRVEQLQSQFENPDGFSGSVSGDSISSHNDSTARSEDLDSSSTESSSSEYSDWIAEHGLEPPKRNKRKCNKRSVPKPSISAAKKQNMEVPEVYRPSEWLSEVIPKKFPYYPQMGDEVMFFKEGYHLYLDAVRKRGVYELQPSQITPWGKIHIKEPELVKIIGIKYELRPPRLCCLRLAVMKQNGRLTGDRFSIKYHDVPDVIDFLVLRQTYETAIARNWDVGDRFRSMIDDGWWWGKILSRRADAQSEFLSYFTRWDNREEENMSPWDMEPVDPDREPAEEGGSLTVLPEEFNAILYHPRPDEWPGGNRDIACDRILRGLDDIMGLSVAEPFIAPVDINQYPSYAFVVEYPIDLSTIKARFENRFYRRVTAAQFDVRYLATNAEKFNEVRSPIVRHARIVTDLCLKVIKELSDIDVPVLYRHLLESYKSETSDEELKINIDSPGPSTSRQASARTLRAVTRRAGQSVQPKSSHPFDWRRACKEMLETLWNTRDSEPFREPVDRLEHPDYDKIVSTPMDLWTVREELRGDNYANPSEFWKDIKLIFSNSKTYSPDTRSKIYAMTTRLSVQAERLMDTINENHRTSVRRHRRVVTKPVRRRRLNRLRKPNSRYVQNGTLSDSDDDESHSDEDNDDDEEDDTSYPPSRNNTGITRRPAASATAVASASSRRRRPFNKNIGGLKNRGRPAPRLLSSRNNSNNNNTSSDDDSDDDRPLVKSIRSNSGGIRNSSSSLIKKKSLLVNNSNTNHSSIISRQPFVKLSRVRMRTRINKKEVNYTMSSTGSDEDDHHDDDDEDNEDEDERSPPQKIKHTVNGYQKRNINRRGSGRGGKKKFIVDNSDDDDDNDDEEFVSPYVDKRRKRPMHAVSDSRFDSANDHTYHSSSLRRSQVQNRNGDDGGTSIGGGRGRKRRKPPSDSESNHSQKPKVSSSSMARPKRSVKRKNYAAMVASGSESLGDDSDQTSMKKVLNKGKSLMKNDYKRINKGSQKKSFEDTSIKNNKINNNNNNSLNSSSNLSTNDNSNSIYATRRAFLKQDKSKSAGGMRTRPTKKEVNYGEGRSLSTSTSEQDVNNDFDDEEEEEGTFKITPIRVIKNNLQPVRRRGRKPKTTDGKLQFDSGTVVGSNGYAGASSSRVTRVHKKVIYNEEEDDLDDENDPRDLIHYNRRSNRHEEDDDDEEEDEEEVEEEDEEEKSFRNGQRRNYDNQDGNGNNDNLNEDDEDDVSEDEENSDFELKNRNVNKIKRTIGNRNESDGAGVSVGRHRSQFRGRKRRKKSMSDSDYDEIKYRTSSRPNAGKRRDYDDLRGNYGLRRSKRPHRPVKDESDFISSEEDENPTHLSISSRGRIRKLSPRVRAFLRD